MSEAVYTGQGDVEPPLPPPTRVPREKGRCFSGDGRMTSRRWAPGGDTRYRERLRRAYENGRLVPDPWQIAEHGGIEAEPPAEIAEAGGWRKLPPMEVARRLDEERQRADQFVTDPEHWQNWLTFTERRNAEAARARANSQARWSESRAASAEEVRAQLARPRRHQTGTAELDPDGAPGVTTRVQVIEIADPQQIIVLTLEGERRQVLIADNRFTPDSADEPAATGRPFTPPTEDAASRGQQ